MQILVCISYNFYFTTVIYQFDKKFPTWQTNINQAAVDLKISKKSFKAKLFYLTILVLALCGSFLYVVPSSSDDETDLQLFLVYKQVPHGLQKTLIWVRKISYVLGGYYLQVPICQMAYVMQSNRYRMYFLLHHLKNININYENINIHKLAFNINYQKVIKQRLIFCIKRHEEVIVLTKQCCKQAAVFIFLFTVAGSFLSASILLNVVLVSLFDNFYSLFLFIFLGEE